MTGSFAVTYCTRYDILAPARPKIRSETVARHRKGEYRLRPSLLTRFLVPAILATLASACTRLPEPEAYLEQKSVAAPLVSRFTVCHGYDCTFRTPVKLPPEDWRGIRANFQPPPSNAVEERRAIAAAVAKLEQLVGKRIGTASDVGGLAYIAAGNPTQQDCIDESTNTTMYMMLLMADDLLQYHAVSSPASRGVFLDGRWYHQSAVIVELATNREYVVDSWFEDNGKPPIITGLRHWQLSYGRPSGT